MKFSGSLSRSILANTTGNIFWRGVEYAHSGNVQDFREDPKKISAKVVGSNPYEVEFRQGPKYVKGYCICPYALNEDYCKHVVALAVYWDMEQGIALPNHEEVQNRCVEIDYGFGKKIEDMYRDPLHADLQLLADASDYGSWARPHAKIALAPPLPATGKGILLQEARSAFEKIARFETHVRYDSYFCAGEISALLSLAYDALMKRLEGVSKETYVLILKECIVFYYDTYLAMIDGSDGVWQIPFARIQYLFGEMESYGVTEEEKNRFRADLNQTIRGWGDIVEELTIQF